MGLAGTVLIYAVLGLVVAVAVAAREAGGLARRLGLALLSVVFWPVFAPGLLASPTPASRPASPRPEPPGPLSARIQQAQEHLLAALTRVEGVAEEVLAPEVMRVRAVAGQLAAMERRVQEMDELLATPEFDLVAASRAVEELVARGALETDARLQSVRARLRNVERLRSMRERTCDDLERVVLKLEEMSSQLQLLKFAGRSDTELVQVIKEVAQSVEEVTEGLLAIA